MKTVMSSAMVALMFVAGGSIAEGRGQTRCEHSELLKSYSGHYYAVKELHGARAPGRNIRRHGLFNGRKSTCRQIRRSRDTLKRMRFPGATMLKPGLPYQLPAHTRTLSAGGVLSSIASCESGGDPRAISSGGTYRGKYQFDYGTWRSVGGVGDPAAASEAEQDRRAATLYAQRGSAPWPVCGR